MSTSLYSLEQEYIEILQAVEQADGELTAEMQNRLQINEKDLERKAKGYKKMMEFLETLNAGIDKEISKLTELKETRERGIERLRAGLLQALLLFGEEDPKTGVKRLEYDTMKLSTRRSKGGVEISDAEKIETKYCNFSLAIKNLTREQQEFIEAFISKTEETGTPTVKKAFVIDKKSIKAAIDLIKTQNEARKTLDPHAERELEEVPGAHIADDKIGLTIK